MNFLLKLFTWWDGATIGTSLFSAMNGEQVGTDAQGNTYFRSKTKKTTDGRERRWVIYDGANDASVQVGLRGHDDPPSKSRCVVLMLGV